MKTHLMLLAILSSLLCGCYQAPTVRDTKQCFTYFGVNTDGTVNLDESYCGCRAYRFSEEYIGIVPNTKPWKEPLLSCQKLVGWTPDEYEVVSNYWGEVRLWILKVLNRTQS